MDSQLASMGTIPAGFWDNVHRRYSVGEPVHDLCMTYFGRPHPTPWFETEMQVSLLFNVLRVQPELLVAVIEHYARVANRIQARALTHTHCPMPSVVTGLVAEYL